MAVTRHLIRYNVRERQFPLAPWFMGGYSPLVGRHESLEAEAEAQGRLLTSGEDWEAEEGEASAGCLSPYILADGLVLHTSSGNGFSHMLKSVPPECPGLS